MMLEGPVKLRVFYTTTDMTNPNVNLKLIMGKDNLTSNVTVPNMPASHNDPENIYFAGVNADFIGGMGMSVLRLRTERCIKVIRGPDGMQ
ncbi:hypothetical protein NXY31_26700 [Bacteroides salyersiae]|nr:hypothetical protein [Bacteroides salyersiae]